jgi:hypothetical protein
MADDDHRHISRDSLFLLAELRVPGQDALVRVKVRNLSAGGMMAEGAVNAVRGTLVEVNIRNVGWVEGAIVWTQGDRCGIAFSDDIDPMIARAPVAVGEGTPRFVKPPINFADREQRLRKI